MLQVARLARLHLGDSAPLVVEFVRKNQSEHGGFKNRAGQSDLYYTVFALDSLHALQAEIPVESVAVYLHSFGSGESLDFVHLACLARCWAALSRDLLSGSVKDQILARLEAYRSRDGGFQERNGAAHGTTYGSFLALGAYQDLGGELPAQAEVLNSTLSLKTRDGGFANQPGLPGGTTPATAAAVTVLRHLGAPVPREVGDWLLSRSYREGGFFAGPDAPMPDLLSTATALHALSSLRIAFDDLREPCLDFIDTLWSSEGSFYGNWTETALDCEYTFYGLLALGHLSY